MFTEYEPTTRTKVQRERDKRLVHHLFVPLFQSSLRGEGILGSDLDQILSSAGSHFRYRQIARLRDQLGPYGITIRADLDPKDRANGNPATYYLEFNHTLVSSGQLFFKIALMEGAHQIKPLREKVLEMRNRQRNIPGIYYGSQATHIDIANMYGISHQAVSQTIKRSMRNLYNNSSVSVQEAFPLNELKFRKSLSLRSRQKESLSKGSLSLKLVENRELLQRLKDEEDMLKLTELLKKVNYEPFRRNARGENPLFISVNKLARTTGFHYSSEVSSFVTILRNNNIPVINFNIVVKTGPQQGTHRYYSILSKHQDMAAQALLQDPTITYLLENPFRQICGPSVDKFPNTTNMKRRKLYNSLGTLMKRLGYIVGKGFATESIFAGCPVPVFIYAKKRNKTGIVIRKYIYPAEMEQTLTEFIQSKIQKAH